MSKYSYNYKNLKKCPETFECFKDKTSIYNNNNKPQISGKLRKARLLNSISNLGYGSVKYGNFGNLLNANVINNAVVSNLIGVLQENQNSNNYVYVNNTIQNYSQSVCYVQNATLENNSVNYNQYYNNYYQLQNILNKPNIVPNNFIFKNKY